MSDVWDRHLGKAEAMELVSYLWSVTALIQEGDTHLLCGWNIVGPSLCPSFFKYKVEMLLMTPNSLDYSELYIKSSIHSFNEYFFSTVCASENKYDKNALRN